MVQTQSFELSVNDKICFELLTHFSIHKKNTVSERFGNFFLFFLYLINARLVTQFQYSMLKPLVADESTIDIIPFSQRVVVLFIFFFSFLSLAHRSFFL